MSNKMYVFQVLVEPEIGKNHVQISTEIAGRVGHVAASSVGSGVNISLIDNNNFPNSLVSRIRKALELSICTEEDLSQEWLARQIGIGSETFKLVASKNPSLVYVEP